jgi:hypothetical protein
MLIKDEIVKINYILFIIIVCLMCSTPKVKASLIESDLLSMHDGLITKDTLSGLQWLDVSVTVGLSRSEVINSPWLTTYGFRYASLVELNELYDHAGGNNDYLVPRLPSGNPDGVPIITNYIPSTSLINLLGCTSHVVNQACDGIDQDWHIGMYGNLDQASIVDAFNLPDRRHGKGAIWTDYSTTVDVTVRNDVGSYLVRPNSVPEPYTVYLLCIGLIGLIKR